MANLTSIGECVLSAANRTCPNDDLCLDALDLTADGHVSAAGVLFEAFLLLYSFYAVAVIADCHLVVSLETLCVRWNVREDVAGASFMAFGSAAPEIIINAVSTIKTILADAEEDSSEDTALGVGAIIGSGMIAFTVIPGVCGLVTSEPLALKRRPLARDVLAYSLALLLLFLVLQRGTTSVEYGGLMVGLYVVYMLVVVSSPGVRQLYRVNVLGRAPRIKRSFVEQQQQQPAPPAESRRDEAGLSPLHAVGTSSSAVPTVIATAVPTHEAPQLWDALPVSPMEFSPLDITTSLSGAPPAPAGRPALAGVLRAAGALWKCLVAPLELMLRYTCPECAHDSPTAAWYPLTLLTAFTWVSFFSYLISAVVSRWGKLLCVPSSFLGLFVIAIGAEIPDTIQSVTVARRGYGSMAVSNSTGSQIINILIGLGLPWLLSSMAGKDIPLGSSAEVLQGMARMQALNVVVYLSLILLPTVPTWRPGDHSKASLGRKQAFALLLTYVVSIGIEAFSLATH
ncbi:hypothetical protein AB1Y20_018087 [Prymnesium parvum]|uniref:Sodium/calcium exchanger membrane region domain-containing protein n=1 Tax=Prymnesium parvum TaxID=97485 RepID=A0AB34JMF0_PRYPA